MKVLITGGGGFLGGRLAQALLKRGTLADANGIQREITQISLLDITFPAQDDSRLKYVCGDLTDPALLSTLIGPETTSVFHLASIVSGGAEADFELGMRVNLDGTRAVMEACRKQARVPRFIFSSSVAAFGYGFPPVVDDNVVALPLNSYGAQKVCCEYLINDYSRRGFIDGRVLRLPTISVRPGKPNLAKSSYASGIIREPLNGVPARCPVTRDTGIWILSPGKVIDAMIHAHDLPASAWGVNRVLNLCGTTATAGEMVDALRRIAGDSVANLVEWAPDEDIQAFIDSLPVRFKTNRALMMGFVADKDVDTIIRDYIADQGIPV
ncbi:D-erythronate dehydrogenase [uncultured Propionivibrio sp.]|uniref:D-erythronate dehydrogenase n=1 Tax=uncultured Propionivibrio sp. TaxID=426737 RepID=UPI0029C0471D|nr:D-erythronate dehydrogenase [uncultured Propionivibrio sp.]